jgi:hypothetical protein
LAACGIGEAVFAIALDVAASQAGLKAEGGAVGRLAHVNFTCPTDERRRAIDAVDSVWIGAVRIVKVSPVPTVTGVVAAAGAVETVANRSPVGDHALLIGANLGGETASLAALPARTAKQTRDPLLANASLVAATGGA